MSLSESENESQLLDSAYNEGINAFNNGLSLEDNPYMEENPKFFPCEYSCWLDGFANRRDGAE